MTERASTVGSTGATSRSVWLAGTLACTAGAFAAAILLAPPTGAGPTAGLTLLLFVGSSVHVASSGWFVSVAAVRGYARSRPRRYVVAPVLLVAGAALAAVVVPATTFAWLLLGYYSWQFFHFQKQNQGMAALAGLAYGSGSVTAAERRAIVAAGLAGIAALAIHPELLELELDVPWRDLFPLAFAAYVVAVLAGFALLAARPPDERCVPFVMTYTMALLFFLPVFVFGSPYAAVGGLVIAHGLQYLVITGLVAGAERDLQRRAVSLFVFVNVALLGGMALNLASHTHGGAAAARAVYGCYLGVVMAHFVFDAGIWRLRDPFPRRFLSARLPMLLPATAGGVTSCRGWVSRRRSRRARFARTRRPSA